MITPLNKETLYNAFGVNNFNSLDDAINNMAPSIVEYYLSDLYDVSNINDTGNGFYLNKRNIENSITISEYNIYIDYSDEVFLEIKVSEDENETGTLWWLAILIFFAKLMLYTLNHIIVRYPSYL